MIVFSEKVIPTFTDSNHDIIVVNNLKEIFFDVYELEINGSVYVAERVRMSGLDPVIRVPIKDRDGDTHEFEVVAKIGESFQLLINASGNIQEQYYAADCVDSILEEEVLDFKESIDTEFEFLNVAENYNNNILEDAKKNAVLKIDNKIKAANKKIKRAAGIQENKLKHLNKKSQELFLNELVSVEGELRKIILNVDENTSQNIKDLLLKYESISRNINRAIKKINITKTGLEGDISKSKAELVNLIEDQRAYIESLHAERLDKISLLVEDPSNRENIIEYFKSDTRNLNAVADELRAQILEESRSLNSIKKDLEGNISKRFTQEISALKRLIELSSGGGGSVAVQFAAGGTVNGDLEIVGRLTSVNSADWDSVYSTVQANSGAWGAASAPILQFDEQTASLSIQGSNAVSLSSLSGSGQVADLQSIDDRINSIFSYLVQNFDNNIIATSSSIEDFVSNEWSELINLSPGDTVTLSASNTVYILGEGDGSGSADYYVVNLKPNFMFFKTGLNDYGIVDSFPLSATKTSKYIIQVEDITTSDIYYAEINVVSNGTVAATTEYGSNYTTHIPFIEFGASVVGSTVHLSAIADDGHSMDNFIIKGNRSNLF